MADATFEDCRRFVRGANLLAPLLAAGSINGYAVGRKRVGGEETDRIAIIVYVSRKLALERLAVAGRIPRLICVPDHQGTIDYVTDVQEATFAALALTSRSRPAAGGASIGHVDITAGTLGGLVRDTETGELVILSNNHVLANSNQASLGDPILQPGPADGGRDPDDRIALLSGYAEIDFSESAENHLDAAIAAPIDPDAVAFATTDVGDATPAQTRALAEDDLGLFVHKTGRTTEHTQGYVAGLFATVRVGYDLFRTATFVDQIIVSQSTAEEDFSDGGDSGSLVYDSDNACVGLLFAGSQGAPGEPARTILNPIDGVLGTLGLELLTEDEPASGGALA